MPDTKRTAPPAAPIVRRDPDGSTITVRDMPLQTREASIVGSDSENRTATLKWTAGAEVRRYDYWNDRYYLEVLSLEPGHVRMGRLQSGRAPVLDTHRRYTLEGVVGVVTSAALGEKDGDAQIKFSRRADVAPLVQDVADQIICNVSVGYQIHRIRMVSPAKEGDLWRYEIIDWEPDEVSLVPIGADDGSFIEQMRAARAACPNPNEFTPDFKGLRVQPCEFIDPPAAAGINPEVTAMTEEEKRAAEEAKQRAAEKAARDRIAEEARVAERQRLDGIREAVITLGGLDESFARSLCDNPDVTPAEAGLAVLREKAKRAAANPTRSHADISITRDEVDTRRRAMEGAILLRLAPQTKLTAEQAETTRQYRHMSLLRMAEEGLAAQKIDVRGLPAVEIAGRALQSTSDFPFVLANVANKRLRAAYEENAGTFKRWARRAPNAPDFKQMQVVQLGAAPDLKKVAEGGEFTYGKINEGREVYQVATYGRIVAFSRQALVNDDLRAFDRLIGAFAASAARLENRIIYGILTDNAAMGDTVALFDAAHGNVSAAAAISVASLGEGRAKMRLQKGLAGEELNVTPAFLLVPAALEQVAYQYTSSQFVPAKASDTNEFRQGGRTALEPIVEPLLDAHSASKWYLAANSAQIYTIEYCYLDGFEGVYIENEIGFDVDGMKIKARDDFAGKAIDYRGLYRNG